MYKKWKCYFNRSFDLEFKFNFKLRFKFIVVNSNETNDSPYTSRSSFISSSRNAEIWIPSCLFSFLFHFLLKWNKQGVVNTRRHDTSFKYPDVFEKVTRCYGNFPVNISAESISIYKKPNIFFKNNINVEQIHCTFILVK